MKLLNWKNAAIAGGVLVAAFAVYYFSQGKNSRPAFAVINPAFGEYISSYTSLSVNSGSTIRIILAKEAIDSAAIGEASTKLFEFSPSVKGITVWLDRRTVEFRPSGRLKSGQVYDVSFFLSKLREVPPELGTFEYAFQVIPQNYELSIDNVKPYVKTQLARQKIEGSILTADFADGVAVEKMLTASQDGKSLKVSWTHTTEGKQHSFIVEDVQRLEKASNVNLALTGQRIDVERNEQKDVEIPALNDFKVINVNVEQGSNQHVVIQFSDPLSEKQNLEGLISIEGLSNLDFEIKDNEVLVFPPVRQVGSKQMQIEAGIRNSLDYKMPAGGNFDVSFEQLLPAVRFTGKGTILPSSDGLILPFEAVNLKSVNVQIVKVFENNILQFFQVNDLDGNQELRRVGKPVFKKTVSLENAGVSDLGKWNRFTLDLAKLITAEPGAIYKVSIGFKKANVAYACDDANNADETVSSFEGENYDDEGERENSYWDSYEDGYYYGEDYDWNQRDNPCNSAYYNGNRNIARNVLASDIGLIAKRGADGNTIIIANDLKTTQPMGGVQLELYDYQQQLVGSASTGSDGKSIIATKKNPYVLIAKAGAQRGYLKLHDGEALSLSNFDVGGEQVRQGIKGFLYGERGVWRPGDSLYLSFVLEDKLKLMPPTHPVIFELQNPQGQVTSRIVRSSSENGFYKFATATASDAPTGYWLGRVKVGGAEFTQPVRIETVKPNRLRIKLDFGVDKILAGNNNIAGSLQVDWLHGAPGKNLKAQFEVLMTTAETKFARYPDYTFEDPSKKFSSEAKPVFDGYTDATGHAVVNATLDPTADAPGMLNAVFRGKAFEESGNFSIDNFSIPFYPYTSFTGIRLPQGDRARSMLLTDTTHVVDVVTIDANGNPVSHSNIAMTIYKLNWRWWWDATEGDVNFMSGQYAEPIAQGNIQTVNGKGTWKFKIKYPEWGRFLIKAVDPVSGHSTAKVVYIDWPGWAGRARNESSSATMLSFSSDKAAYNIGEKATLTIPGSDNGRALISVESGSRVIQTYWLETKKGDNPFAFDITDEMTPNIFVSVTMLQPHAQTVNDLPIRMYGVIPIQVENPKTHLNPVLTMPDVLEPGQEVSIKVSEQANRKMTYTLAVVEEGLLDLTHFKTPDAWTRFYAREALGVKTWDLYDQVMGAFGGRIERLLAIGGDGDMEAKEDDSKSNRFKPVVKFFGPFTMDGGTKEHKFTMPQYIGSVKTMLVAGYEGAYGKAEKATPVRKPLMVLATLPRVLGPEENVKLPITLFANEKGIRNANVTVKVSGLVSVADGNRTVNFPGIGDVTTDFDLTVKSATGFAKIEVTATSGNYKATDVINIEVRNPNPPVSKSQDVVIEAGKSWSAQLTPVGLPGTNSATLEVSSLPPINLGQRLKYLIHYPYGCIEQTTSSVFPQLYLSNVKTLTDGEKSTIQKNIGAAVERLKSFVNRDGGFSYWPGGEDSDSWGTTYAGHFLNEAEAKGYFVPHEMIKRWKKYQRNKAQGWRKNNEYSSSELNQAYRLYTLALAGDPDLASMNRLREIAGLPPVAGWMLAAAYAKAGQPEAAKKLIANLSTNVKPYQELAYSYGSDLRDKAVILETLVLLGEREKGFQQLKDISTALNNDNYWMSTQAISWCLKAVGGFAGLEQKGEMKFKYTFNGKEVTASTGAPVAQVTVADAGGKLSVTNDGKGVLFARVVSEGTPARGQEESAASNLVMDISYADTDGNVLDPTQLEQGKEFVATVSISNPGIRGIYKNLALKQIFPSGWEINNLRLEGSESRLTMDVPTYQDIRDDRVYTYFDLNANQRKTFKVLLTASYAGTFYLPAVNCEAMYDHSIYARTKGQDVSVVKVKVQ